MIVSMRLLDPPPELANHGFVFTTADGVPPTTIRERGSRRRWTFNGWSGRTALYRRA